MPARERERILHSLWTERVIAPPSFRCDVTRTINSAGCSISMEGSAEGQKSSAKCMPLRRVSACVLTLSHQVGVGTARRNERLDVLDVLLLLVVLLHLLHLQLGLGLDEHVVVSGVVLQLARGREVHNVRAAEGSTTHADIR